MSDQVYRNWTRGLAALIAVLLALAGGWTLDGASFCAAKEVAMALLVGLLATPWRPSPRTFPAPWQLL